MAKDVLLIGDVIIDKFTYGSKLGVSAETPTVVGKFLREESFLGGAGLVLRNMLRLGCAVKTIFPVGNALPYHELLAASTTEEERSRHYEGFLPTPVDLFRDWRFFEKRRYFIDFYKMVQYDVLNKNEYTLEMEDVIKRNFLDALTGIDCVVVADNRHGCITRNIATMITTECIGRNIPVYVDSQVSQNESNHLWYRGVDNFLLNEKEFRIISGYQDPVQFDDVVWRGRIKQELIGVTSKLLCGSVYLKLGPYGSVAYNSRLDTCVFYEAPHLGTVVDTCGAGDAFLAALVASGEPSMATHWATMSTLLPGTRVPETRKE